MIEIAIHPNVYRAARIDGLRTALESIWVNVPHPSCAHFFIISGFANYNGGVRFYNTFREHTSRNGKITAYFGGSTSQRLTSRQVVKELLECGVNVNLVNRKRLMHLKCYGVDGGNNALVVSSGNFTGPGMSQNVEMSALIKDDSYERSQFSWMAMIASFQKQGWDVYRPTLDVLDSPAWKLLYDESDKVVSPDESIENSLIITLSHSDTARINATSGSDEGKGTQYFWLSKDCFDFFPPLLTQNARGVKPTFSCLIDIEYVDLNKKETVRVTFEAGNNLDFRLGTGMLRYTNIAEKGDIAAISRIEKDKYQLRIFRKTHVFFAALYPYVVNFIGHQGKKYGYISNQLLANILNISIGKVMPQMKQSDSG